MRLWVVIPYSGIYLATDVECIRSLTRARWLQMA